LGSGPRRIAPPPGADLLLTQGSPSGKPLRPTSPRGTAEFSPARTADPYSSGNRFESTDRKCYTGSRNREEDWMSPKREEHDPVRQETERLMEMLRIF